jgi:hypothetical protein
MPTDLHVQNTAARIPAALSIAKLDTKEDDIEAKGFPERGCISLVPTLNASVKGEMLR